MTHTSLDESVSARPLPAVSAGFLYLAAFIGGAATMSIEFGASRLLGSVFGTSNLVWAVIIGLVLVYLTVGSWLGGRLADRHPRAGVLFTIVGLAGASTMFVPLVSRPILRAAAAAFDVLQIPLLAGSFIAVLVLFLVPVTLLGMVTPFILKLMVCDTAHTGRVTGRVSATSTVGSFVGTFVTVLVLIPQIGTARTFLLISLLLLLLAGVGFHILQRRISAVICILLAVTAVLFTFLGLPGATKSTPGLLYERESGYNYVQVIERDGYRYLRLNEGQGVHSVYHPTQLYYGGPWSQVLTAPYFNPTEYLPQVRRIAVLGLAAGTTARQANEVYPKAIVEGYEIDPMIVEVGETYFGMEDLPNLRVNVEDARWGLANSKGSYDIISIDAYQAPYIPAHLVTLEFFELVRANLSPNGVMVINAGRSPQNRELVDALSSTIAQVFPQVFVTDLESSFNSIIFATMRADACWEHFSTNYQSIQALDPGALLDQAMALTLRGRTKTVTDSRVFTDDLAPIEMITNRIVLDYVFGGEQE